MNDNDVTECLALMCEQDDYLTEFTLMHWEPRKSNQRTVTKRDTSGFEV